jgi:hypothetical protein
MVDGILAVGRTPSFEIIISSGNSVWLPWVTVGYRGLPWVTAGYCTVTVSYCRMTEKREFLPLKALECSRRPLCFSFCSYVINFSFEPFDETSLVAALCKYKERQTQNLPRRSTTLQSRNQTLKPLDTNSEPEWPTRILTNLGAKRRQNHGETELCGTDHRTSAMVAEGGAEQGRGGIPRWPRDPVSPRGFIVRNWILPLEPIDFIGWNRGF